MAPSSARSPWHHLVRTLTASLSLAIGIGSCRGEPPPTGPALPEVTWEGSWPVTVLTDPLLGDALDPLDAYSATWLISPQRNDALPWADPWALEQVFPGESAAATIGRARAMQMHAGAWRALASLDAEASCRLGRSTGSYGAHVPTGYLFGVEGCLWSGDLDGARAAWALWQTHAPDDASLAWPAPPHELPGREALADRALPVSGWPSGGPEAGPPAPAWSTVYRSHDQEISYAFVLPGDLWRVARWFEARSEQILDGCTACPSDIRTWLGDGGAAGAPSCASPAALLPVIVGSLPISAAHVCSDAGQRPPGYPAAGGEGATISDLDGAAEAWIDGYLAAVEAGAVRGGSMPPEALPTVRDFARRAVYRSIGLDAARAGDNEVSLWALEMASGDVASTATRGANDPEMICSLALARFRAGHHRPAVQSLDAAGESRGWDVAPVLARTVARVEALPGADSVGVMR